MNRGQDAVLPLEADLRGLDLGRVVEHQVVADADPGARNTLAEPERVVPHAADGTRLAAGVLKAGLEPLPWNMIRLARRTRPPPVPDGEGRRPLAAERGRVRRPSPGTRKGGQRAEKAWTVVDR